MRQGGLYVYTWKENVEKCYERLQCNACFHALETPSEDQKPKISLLGGDGTYCLVEKTSRDNQVEKLYPFLEKVFANHNQATPNLSQKKANTFH